MIIIAMPLHVVLLSLLAVVLLSLLVSRNNRNSDENFERLASVLLLFLETNTERRNVFSTPPLTIVFSLAMMMMIGILPTHIHTQSYSLVQIV
jgi:hypothetical protein